MIPRFLPVIHVKNDLQAVTQAGIALSSGAQGFFLIDHSRYARHLLRTYEVIREAVGPTPWIGINFLDLSARTAADALPPAADGLWVDLPDPLMRQAKPVFAGVAFKYQDQPADLRRAASDAADTYGVVTTSGESTGEPPTIEKASIMREGVGTRPLALASGVSIKNVQGFLPLIDHFLVATSISSSFHTLDPYAVRDLADAINSHEP